MERTKNRRWHQVCIGAMGCILAVPQTACLPGIPVNVGRVQTEAPIGHEFFGVHVYDLGAALRVEGYLESEHRDSGGVEIEVIRAGKIIESQTVSVQKKIGPGPFACCRFPWRSYGPPSNYRPCPPQLSGILQSFVKLRFPAYAPTKFGRLCSPRRVIGEE